MQILLALALLTDQSAIYRSHEAYSASQAVVEVSKQGRGRGGQARSTYTEPMAYCRAVGSFDDWGGGQSYRGDREPGWLRGYMRATTDQRVVWRCMGGQMLACLYESDPECSARSDLAGPPTILREFCRDNPGSHANTTMVDQYLAHEWVCRGRTPVIRVRRSTTDLDARGFQRDQWHVVRR